MTKFISSISLQQNYKHKPKKKSIMQNTTHTSSADITIALDVERGEYVFRTVMDLFNEKDCASDVIKALMCSELDSKECFLACYFLGRVKEQFEQEKQQKIDSFIAQLLK